MRSHPTRPLATRLFASRLLATLSLLCLTATVCLAQSAQVTRSNAISELGRPTLPADFPYFPYVNPDAPKGGTVTLAAIGAYDSFNPFIMRGTATSAVVSPWIVLPGGSGSGSTV